MEIEIRRSGRRTLALEVTRDGCVIVRAPNRCTKKQIDEFIAAHEQWLADKLALQRERQLSHPEPTDEEANALMLRAKTEIPEKVAHYAQIMNLAPAGVKITSARTRFGSCSEQNSLCFSWRLMQYPEAAVDYVVVHELAHIIHKNHSRNFYALVARVLPDYKARIALLKG